MSFSEANRSGNIFIGLVKGSLQIFQITEKLEIFVRMWMIDALVDTVCGWHVDIKRSLGLVPFPEQKRVEEIVDHEDLDVCVDSKEFFVSHSGENAFESEEVLEDDRNGTEVMSERLIDISETDSDHISKQIGSEIILTETDQSNSNTAISRECEENIVDHDENKRDTDRSSSENLQVELEKDKRKTSDKENIIQDKEVTNHTEVVASENCSKLKEEVKDSNSIADTADHLAVHKDDMHKYKKDNEEIDEENKQETKKDPLGLETSVNEIINQQSRDRKDIQQSEIYEQPKSLAEIVNARIRDFEIHGVRSWE